MRSRYLPVFIRILELWWEKQGEKKKGRGGREKKAGAYQHGEHIFLVFFLEEHQDI